MKKFFVLFLLVSIFYNLFLLLKAQDVRQKYILAGILGLLCGYITLVRVQFLFFLPLLVLALLILKGYRTLFKYLLISLVIFMIILGSWMSYVYVNTGAIGLTKGREGAMLYSRVARTELSYTDQSRYLVAWLSRSVPGSNWENDPILSKYGWTGTSQAYEKIATSSLQIEKIKEENIHTIVTNPGHFLFGNLIELVKLLYLGHLDSTILGPVFRALIYVLVYSWFIFGMIHFIRPSKKREVKMVQLLLLFFIVYNVAVLTFLDTIPRYNVPYLVFFLLVGFAGLALVQKTPEVDYKKSYENKEDNIF